MKHKNKRRLINKKLLWTLVIGIFLLSIIIEISLRVFWGFCDAPLYVPNEKYEYIAAPNQEGERFGNKYYYNSFSQRSQEPDSSKTIILGLGDSVIYGGVQSDQDSIATSIFNREMLGFQLLNISAGSWGPDNCAAYLNEKGTFGASAMFLVVSSHDAYDNMDFKPVVGVHPSYPKRQYLMAWGELIDRYVSPRISKYFSKKETLDPDQKVLNGIRKEGLVFNTGFEKLKVISESLDIPLIIYLHAEKSELEAGEYNDQGEVIIKWAFENGIKTIKEFDYNFVDSDYRDGIHLSNQGQAKLAQIMKEFLR
tara:strand:- start:2189 stop:3118 length:930 start_codon:yes stop_codon:yes gene_type:complete